jgi:hypothetical protein
VIRLGDWRTVLADVEPDAVIADPPYGERTHDNHGSVSRTDGGVSRPLPYDAWTPDDAAEFVASWAPRTRRWICALTSHDLVPAWEAGFADTGWWSAPPVPVLLPVRPRMSGGGPNLGPVHLVVGRPRSREAAAWRTTAAWYDCSQQRHGSAVVGAKPLGLMGAIVRDYSEPGDLVCDPCAGGGTTLLAALEFGRRAIGAEVDAERYEIAARALARPVQADLFGGG